MLCSRNSAPLHSTLRLVRCLHPLAFEKSPRSVAAHVSSTHRLRRSFGEDSPWRYRMVSGSHRFCAKLRNHRRLTNDVRQRVLQPSKEIEKLQMMKNKASKLICELKQHGQIEKKRPGEGSASSRVGKTKKKLSLSQFYARQLGGTQVSNNPLNQLDLLHKENVVERRFE